MAHANYSSGWFAHCRSVSVLQRSVAGFISIFDKENTLAREFSSLMERNQGCNLEGGVAAASAVPLLVLGLAAVAAALRP